MGILGVVLAVAIISIHASDVTGKTKCSLSFFTLFLVFNSCYYSTKIIELKSKNKTYYYCSEKTFFLTHLNYPLNIGASSDRPLRGKNKKFSTPKFSIIYICNFISLIFLN